MYNRQDIGQGFASASLRQDEGRDTSPMKVMEGWPQYGKPMGFHSPLIRPAIFWGVGIGGVPLGSHDTTVDGNQKSGEKTTCYQ